MRVTNVVSAAAVHAHSGVVVSTICPLPPVALTAESGPLSVRLHFTGDGSEDVTAVDPQAARDTPQTMRSVRGRSERINWQIAASTTMSRSPDTIHSAATAGKVRQYVRHDGPPSRAPREEPPT